jgi:tetratricopeptide (TPR) repeat protein
LTLLVETAEFAGATGPNFERDKAEAHANVCGACGARLRALRSAQANLRSMASTVSSERTRDCPAEDKWAALAAGFYLGAEAAPLLAHASECDYCGPLLREATEDFAPELSAQEQARIGQLPSVEAVRQRDIARKMAELSGSRPAANISSVRETRPHVGWSFSAWTRWAAPVAVAAVLALAAVLWIERSPSLSSTNKLIAQAYTAQRPIELRFPGAGYSPVRQERGEIGPQRSRMDEPPELLEAETQIARGLARHPQDPGWLQAKARTELFDGNYQVAIDALQQAEVMRPDDLSLKLDLGIAYFERGETKHSSDDQIGDYNLALESLNSVLSMSPNNLVALFNRGMVYERLKKSSEATADWQRYLQLDPVGEWTREAKRHVGSAP